MYKFLGILLVALSLHAQENLECNPDQFQNSPLEHIENDVSSILSKSPEIQKEKLNKLIQMAENNFTHFLEYKSCEPYKTLADLNHEERYKDFNKSCLKIENELVQKVKNSGCAFSTAFCWRYVKCALMQSGFVDSYLESANAIDVKKEKILEQNDFKDIFEEQKSSISKDQIPYGAILVYKHRDQPNHPGHIEIKTPSGYVSDFRSQTPIDETLKGARVLVGVYIPSELNYHELPPNQPALARNEE